ncbi:hypothetical protein ElyMa_005779500 [Elysia marginata]|uniref:Uncharacterized protein n=1 Tax=Elysia marginata TaxID=1093978 RepID=A0AAV4FQV1_9GAST|nr:hypothetical protein ElyMa_005779500 [Elysia marginata]
MRTAGQTACSPSIVKTLTSCFPDEPVNARSTVSTAGAQIPPTSGGHQVSRVRWPTWGSGRGEGDSVSSRARSEVRLLSKQVPSGQLAVL